MAWPAPGEAQSSAYATVSGTVSGPAGVAVGRASVTLSPIGGAGNLETSTSGTGTFVFSLVRPGGYELRVEALGYRPLIARIPSLAGGEDRSVDLTLTSEPPPVLAVDTIVLPESSFSNRRVAGGMRLGATTIDDLPYRIGDLASVASMSTAFDESLGAQGLTGDETVLIGDGVPFYRAPHPTVLTEAAPSQLFPVGLLGSVAPAAARADMAWPGATGGYVSVGTRSSTAGLEGGASYSGDAGWFSDELEIETPSLLSYEGWARGAAPIRNDGSQLLVAADVLSHEVPRPPRLSDATILAGSSLDPALLNGLVEPSVERFSRYVGLARLDLNQGTTGRAFVRAVGGYVRRSFEGAGPLPWASGSTPAEESVDVSLAGGYVTRMSSRTTVELRGGFSGSYRDFKGPFDGLPPVSLAESASVLGSPSYTGGESSRTDVVLMPMLRRQATRSALQGGISIRVSDHTMARGSPDVSERVYSDQVRLLDGEGYGELIRAPEASFGTQELGLFAQYEVDLGEVLHLRFGARYDFERVGSDRPALNSDWLEATGLSNDEYPGSFHQLGVGGALTWDPTRSGRTQITLSGSSRDADLDPRRVFEVISYSTDGEATKYLGGGLDWPYGAMPAAAEALPTLTLLGPDTRAPRTTSFSAGLRQDLTRSTTLFVEGALRRTDFMARRRNLNLPETPQFTDPYGRPVYGTLRQQGALVAATGDDVRRFSGFGDVWALDPDGWSEYRGLTLGIDHGSESVDLLGSYTYSQTRDNRVGAAEGAVDASLRPGLPDVTGEEDSWSEGVSDFDAPHRVAAGVKVRTGVVEISGIYRYRSGSPFTPGYRTGVDANGDGSIRNDVAWVPDRGDLGAVVEAWPCLEDQVNGFAERNSCRGPAVHSVDARLRIRLGRIGRHVASLTVDGLNLIEPSDGVIDDALLLVDPESSIESGGGEVEIPVSVNPTFGRLLYASSRGRMLRIGLRVGG